MALAFRLAPIVGMRRELGEVWNYLSVVDVRAAIRGIAAGAGGELTPPEAGNVGFCSADSSALIDMSEKRRWQIGELAKKTGLSVRALRHYDELGPLKPSERSDAGYRLYAEVDVRRLFRIVALRDDREPGTRSVVRALSSS